MTKCIDINLIKYKCPPFRRGDPRRPPLEVIGIDTEAYTTGRCFLICTSEGDNFTPSQFPKCLFTRRYRNRTFVAYNLKYEISAFLQRLTPHSLAILRNTGECTHKGYKYAVIGNKCLKISKGKNAVTMFDIYNFYMASLDKVAQQFLADYKLKTDVKTFTPESVQDNFSEVVNYCIKDAILVRDLATLLIAKFRKLGIEIRKLYSIAYVSYQYFSTKCPYVVVKRYWRDYRYLLDYAIKSYNGGKFEVTKKGAGYYYEYDIVSAYPSEIANLIDISWARVEHDKKYRKDSIYSFLKCVIDIPFNVHSPVALKQGTVNTYPVGRINKVITKKEYEYLLSVGCTIKIINAWHILCDNKQYPYRYEINKLSALKAEYKSNKNKFDYHVIKIMMNSLYGKFVQLIESNNYWKAGRSWNPIYASVICANTRLHVTQYQQIHSSVVAVHTDSIISDNPLPIQTKTNLGAMSYECEGQGVILGSGVYQIGDKVRFRGLERGVSIMDTLRRNKKTLKVDVTHCNTWRETIFHNWDTSKINLFENKPRNIRVDFDKKRLWLNDWKNWTEPLQRSVESSPWVSMGELF